MNFRRLFVLTLLALAMAVPALAEADVKTVPESQAQTSPLTGTPLEPFIPFLGNWEVEAKWANGEPIWARNEYEIGLGGKFVFARTWTKDGSGEAYERYQTYFGVDPDSQRVKTWGFTYDGTFAMVEDYEVTNEGGKPSFTSVWASGPAEIKQTVALIDAKSYAWKVWTRTAEGGEWQQIMDGVWKRKD